MLITKNTPSYLLSVELQLEAVQFCSTRMFSREFSDIFVLTTFNRTSE